jgi:HPt (histidine-containing phosphotransfer) domain-containing protein
MDVGDALSRLGNDRELLSDIIGIFLEDSPALLEKIRRAVMANDPNALQRAAHSLKGLAATLSAEDVAAASRRLELMGASNGLSDAVAAVTQLETLLSELSAAAQGYIQHPR